MRDYAIYIIRNTVNEKVYIGQTSQSVRERFNQHMKPSTQKARGTYKLYNAIRKYGKDKFMVETLETGIPEREIDRKEEEYIKKYDSYFNGYNSTTGGDGRTIYKIEDMELLKKLYEEGNTLDSIAERFNVTQQTISRTLKLLDLPPRILRVTKEYLINNKDNKTNIEMAEELGVHEETISRTFRRYGIKRGKGCNNGRNRQNHPKLSDKDKEEFVRMWFDRSITQEQISKRFSIGYHAINDYRKRWNLPKRRTINEHGNLDIKY